MVPKRQRSSPSGVSRLRTLAPECAKAAPTRPVWTSAARVASMLKHVRAGDGNVANVARGERGTLGGVLRIDLIRGSSDLYLLVELLSVVQCEGELVEARVKVERFAGEEEEARLANFGLIVPGGKIAQREAPGAIGF